MILLGYLISLIHLIMIIYVPILIIFSKNIKIIIGLFICIIISYTLNLIYENCILTILEKKINNFAIIDLYGHLIPQFTNTLKDCNIAGTSIILYQGLFCFLKLLKLYYFK